MRKTPRKRRTASRRLRPRRRLRGIAVSIPLTAVMVLSPTLTDAATLVTPDGRTQTNLAVSGNTTDVTTSTVKNGNAYNSFSKFQVGQGDTVNLHVPDAAQRLLNVVHDAPVDVQGTLNSYKNGAIGGDIYFADPYGFMVGKNGAVNVGSLTVRTPTKDATDKLIDAHGAISDQAASDLINNVTPVSPDGSIVIQGRINAPDGVHLTGQSVTTANTAHIATGAAAQTEIFNATVNTNGQQQAGGMAVHNGVIEITAADSASVDGTLQADAGNGGPAGQVTVTAGSDINISGTANISAKGNGAASNGGNVKFYAQGNLNVGDGATVNAGAGASGDGGTIELSANGTATISGAASLLTGAVSGKAGSVIIDPTDVVIGSTASPVSGGYTIPGSHASIDSDGGAVTIIASNSITLSSGAWINTRQTGQGGNNKNTTSGGNAGDVTLTAPHLTIQGEIIAVAGTIDGNGVVTNNSGKNDGTVTLTAAGEDTQPMGLSEVNTSIDISGKIYGGAIDIEANATAESKMDLLSQIMYSAVSSIFGAGVGYIDAQATSAIHVLDHAVLNGSGDVTLNSWTQATAESSIFDISALTRLVNSTGFIPGVMVGNVTAEATTQVASGASVTSGGALTVRAHNTADLEASLLTVTGSTKVDATVVYTTATVQSQATVDQGAVIKAHSVDVSALNNNSFTNEATVIALGGAQAGVTVAIADGYRSLANANFGSSDVTFTGTAATQNLTVQAASITDVDDTSASTTTGAGLIERALTFPVANALAGTQGIAANTLNMFTEVKFGAALALTLDNEQKATATLGTDPAHPTEITAGGAVAVMANTVDQGVRSNADASVNSPDVKDATPANPSAAYAMSAGITYSDRTLSADAEIGSGTEITAPKIGVQSSVELPVTITWLEGDSFETVASHINGDAGAANDVLTSYSNSSADAGADGISGSVNIFNVTANSRAQVGQGAKLTSTGGPAGAWSVNLDDGDDASHGLGGTDGHGHAIVPATESFAAAIAVQAYRDIETLNFGGNLSLFLNGAGGTNENANSFGATVQLINYSGDTIADIGAGASVTTNGSVAVNANAVDKAIDVSGAAGRGGNLGFAGMVALFDLDTSVHASVAASAHLSAANLNIAALQSENVGTVAGSLMVGNANSVGAMVTTNTIDTDVKAFVGDNSGDNTSALLSQVTGYAAPTAGITTIGGTVMLAAGVTGLVQSLAVSIDAGDNSAIGAAAAVSNIRDNIGATLDGATVTAKDVYVSASADDTIHTIAVGASYSGDGLAANGSVATGMIAPNVAASITNGAIVTAANNVGVLALNNETIQTIAGNAGIAPSGVGVGISIVVSQISGATSASISGGATQVDANGLDVNDTFLVNSGDLASAPDTDSIEAPSITSLGGETQQTVRGLAIVSTAHQSVSANAATLGVGQDAGIALVPVTTLISSTSNAYISDAQVDAHLTADPKSCSDPIFCNPVYTFHAPDLNIIASNHSYTGDFVAAIAGSSSGLAGAGAASAVKFTGSANAYASDATIGTDTDGLAVLGALNIHARSTQAAAVIVMGGAGGMDAGAASLAVTLFSANTKAYLTGGSTEAHSLEVNATSDNGINVLDGAAAVGDVGIGGSIVVTINNGTTMGYIGDYNGVVNSGLVDQTDLIISGSTSAGATTNNHLHSLVIAGAGGAAFGIAAMADVTTLSSKTISGIYGTDLNDSPASLAGAVTVAAKENDSVDAITGGGAGGAAGVGVAANVVVAHSEVTGTILNSNIRSSGAVSVSAEGDRDLSALTIVGSVGIAFGVSAAAGVVLAGTDASSDVTGELDHGGSGTLTDVNNLSDGASGNPLTSGAADTITASVAGGSLNAASLNVTATGKTSTANQAIGAAAGGFAGVGGAVAYTDIGSTVNATIANEILTASTVALTAQSMDGSDHALSAEAEAGGGGLVGIGAGIAIAKADNHVAALLLGGTATGNGSGSLTMTATDSTSGDSTTIGGAAGGVAVGVMVSTVSKNSHVTAATQNSAALLSYQNITLNATDGGSLSSSATGVSGGLAAAANAAAATSSDTGTVQATLGDGTHITGNSGLVKVTATDNPQASANAFGVAVSDGYSLGASVALVSIAPTVKALTGDNVSIRGAGGLQLSATLAPVTGQHTADASAFAGAGGAMLALNGAVATAINTADVEAVSGSGLTLPGGDIRIEAIDTSDQNAFASGVGVGGIAGGASYSDAEANGTTKATLGGGATALDARTGALTVTATGSDTNNAESKAGTYGLVAGNASVAFTANNSAVTATIGANTSLAATDVTLKAAHTDNYSELGDSMEVSVLGASGAGSEHDANVAVKAWIQTGVNLFAAKDIDVTAQNNFLRAGTDDAADAGGGGVLNGAGATSETNITGSSTVLIDDSAVLVAGNDPVANPGAITILAGSLIKANDVVSLSTGGALQGAGTSNDFSATLNNNVSIGAGDALLSFGNINVGTLTIADVTAKSLASTWGILGAVADATASVNLLTNQTISLAGGANLLAYGNVNVTAGQNPDTADVTSMGGGAQAETYVSGFIAIPAAHAQSDVTNNTTVTMNAGAVIKAGQNVNLGSFTGTLTPQTDGTGHGYELGFIPVTDGSGTDNANAHSNATVTMNGDATAGAFHDLTVAITDCGDTDTVYCGHFGITGGFTEAYNYVPAGALLSQFLPNALVARYASGADAQLLSDGMSSTAVDGIQLNTLFASAGLVSVTAQNLSGSGSFTANGEASITVNNESPDYLVLGAVKIADNAGGEVLFSGGATHDSAVAAGIGVTTTGADGKKSITITNSYDSVVGTSSLGPAIFVTGNIENLGGSVDIEAPFASLGQFAPIIAQNVIINVPQGVLLVDLAEGLLETTGPSPIANWAPFMTIPTYDGTKIPSADLAIAYAVNAVYNPNHIYATDDALSWALYDRNSNPVLGGNPLMGDGRGSDGATILVYGNCLPTRSGNKCEGGSTGPIPAQWNMANFSGFGCCERSIAEVPSEVLTIASNTNIITPNPGASAITANQIAIHATYIDINSDITAGTPTNWSVNLSSALIGQINADQHNYQTGAVTNPKFALTGATVVGANDSLIKVTYVAGATPADGHIELDNVLASSAIAASIKLDGGIMSTDAIGHIHVNAGLGQVTINNQTGTPITVNNISAGNADRSGGLSGSLEIIDTLKPNTTPNHWWYVYTPGQGTSVYSSTDPAAKLADATLISSGPTSSFGYDPLAGMRWAWDQMVFLSRTVTPSADWNTNPTTGNWGFTDPTGHSLGLNANDPWYYVDTIDTAADVAGSGGKLFLYNGQVYTQDTSRAGHLLTGQSTSLPVLLETITGTTTITHVDAINTSCMFTSAHCNVYNRSDDFQNFQSAASSSAFFGLDGAWDFDYISKGTVTVSTSVKADNRIAIDFSGSTRGSVTINSNAAVTIGGQITNPNGDTLVTASGGSITSSANGGITSNNLGLTASNGAVGSASSLLSTTQTDGGVLNASGDQGVFLKSNSALNIGTVASAHGDVILISHGDMDSATTAAAVSGKNVTLTASQGGSIGVLAPLTLAATGTLNATSDGTIALKQLQGDLSVGKVESTGFSGAVGNVNITVDHGALLDASTTTSAQLLTDDQVQAIWSSLKLTAATGAAANTGSNSVTVTAVTKTVNSDYQKYWLLLSHGQVQGAVFTLDAGGQTFYQPAAAAANMTVQQYAQQLYSQLANDFTQYVGANWQSQTAFQAKDGGFSFVPSQAQIDALNANSVWTEGQLKSALSLTALQPSTVTTLGTAASNVTGNNLNLTATNGVGSLAAPVSITIADLKSGNLSPEQQRAIALARNPGEVVFVGTDTHGATVRFTGTQVPAGVTVTSVEIKQTAPLFVSAGGILNASATQGGVFIQAAAGDLRLGTIDAGQGDVSLAAPHSILAANVGTAIKGNHISLLAGAGDLGSAGNALAYQGNEISSATAGGNINLKAVGGDMLVDRMFAGGDVNLDASDGGILAALDGITLIAGNLNLHAGHGDIGSTAHPFSVQLTGALQGSASGNATIASPAALKIGVLSAGSSVSVSAGTISGQAGVTNIIAAAAALFAQHGIGAAAQYLTVSVPSLQAGTAAGGIYIHGLTDMVMADMSLPGALGIQADKSLRIGHLTASGPVTIVAAALDLTDATVADQISLSAPVIATKIIKSGSGPLQINISGLNGALASSSDLDIAAANGVSFGRYAVIDGSIVTTATLIDIVKGTVADQMTLVTPAAIVYMNNVSIRPIANVNVQLFIPGKNFTLHQDGKNTTTTAFVVDFGNDFAVTFVDAAGNAQPAQRLLETVPLSLTAANWVANFAGNEAQGSLEDIYGGSTIAEREQALFPQWVSGVDGGAVNTGVN